ncbi:MAG: hypothetical protein LBQ15_12050 [Clostridium sp.]|jgi:hypothetical protein|nr:hypothetical protein [Clostridium sp.]
MKSQEVRIYREIQKNTQLAMKAMDTLSDKVYDERLAAQISKQTLGYSRIHNQAMENLLQAKAEPYHGSHVENILRKGSLHYNTLLNTSTGRIAEVMIKESNSGILEMSKILNRSEEAGEKPLTLAKELLDFEQDSIETLKQYL